MTQPNDKRRHPRVAHRLRVRSTHREAVELETIDLSAGGLRCTAPVFLPPMTKLAVSLVLPPGPGNSGNGEKVINGEAVVVRTEKLPPGQAIGTACRVALFFSRMDEEDRRMLLAFLEERDEKAGGV